MPRPPLASTAASSPSAPAPASGSAWEELTRVLDQLNQLAVQTAQDDHFYREWLRVCVTALSAEGGAVWVRGPDGRLRRRSLIEQEAISNDQDQPGDDHWRAAHESLLQLAIDQRATQVRAPHSGSNSSLDENPTATVQIVSPVVSDPQLPPGEVIQVALRPGASPAVYEASAQFLEAACEIAGQRSLRREVTRLRADRQEHQRLADLGRRVQGDLDLKRTCHRIAGESRDAVGCDRVSVVFLDENRPRLMAVSGADHVDRRTATARGMEELAGVVARLQEPLYWVDGTADGGEEGPHIEALHRFADRSHARQVVALPLLTPEDSNESLAENDRKIVGVLIAEQFDGEGPDLAKDRLGTAAELCAPALANAAELSQLPMLGISRALRFTLLPKTLRRIALGLAAATIAAACLAFIKTDFYVDAPGELQPAIQQEVFAPRNCLVEAVHVGHGQQVKAGAKLLSLRDPELDLAIKQIDGELATARRQLDAVRATRTGRNQRDASTTDAYRLSAEQQLIEQRQQSLTARRALLLEERAALDIKSPQQGSVVSWQVEKTLIGRPVERGQSLLTIADTTADWRIELQAPDDRIGYVLAAQQAAAHPLRVEYRLASEEEGFATGVVSEIAQRAEPADEPATTDSHYVRIVVRPDHPTTPATDPLGLRPGLSVRARIDCGRRPLGYVWLHDLGRTIKTWWQF